MKYHYAVLLLLISITLHAQNTCAQQTVLSISDEALAKVKLEDKQGHLITDPDHKIAVLARRKKTRDSIQALSTRSAMALSGVPLCTNGGFEEHTGSSSLKDFAYTTGDVLNPMQCRDLWGNATLDIPQYNPGNEFSMARTVPANHLDEYIGDIQAFDQYALKVNYTSSSTTISKVQAKRFKTDNETQLKFNYKAVLQSINNTDHDNEQPFIKGRVLTTSGALVDEFCLIGDPTNCIFTQADALEGDAIILYNANWQSGILDISAIPNNEEFIIEFIGSRCGLGGHFGYLYIDDICLLHSDENLQGSITLDPLYKICPTLPLEVCGTFTIPNSGGVSATVQSVELQIRNSSNAIVYTSQTPTLNLAAKTFCFNIQAANLPNVANMGYNVSVAIHYGLVQASCSGTSFDTATDDDANPGWDIWFLNCTGCDINLHTASLRYCDADHNGTEIFDLEELNPLVATATAGITFAYFTTLADATAATNPIAAFSAYSSGSRTIFIRASNSATCYKIIAAGLIVKNPFATITGILNVCSGSTVLTASPGVSYLWNNGATTPSITATAIGTYSVNVTDSFGCHAMGTVTIPGSLVAAQPNIVTTQPSCFSALGAITITSPATDYSYDNGITWSNSATAANLPVGSYTIKIKTVMGCTSYPVTVNVVPYLSPRPDFVHTNPAYCGDTGSITISTTANAYSFDDGVTWSVQNTMSNLPSGTYNIRVKDQFGCISNYSSVVLNGEFLDEAAYLIENPYCGTLGSIKITTPAAQFSFDGGTTWQNSDTLINVTAGSYIIKIKDAMGCTSPNTYVYLNNLENTFPDYIVSNAGCDTYGSLTITTLGDSYSFDGGTTWTANPTVSNIAAPQNFTLKVRKGSCSSYTNSAYFYTSYLPLPVVNDYEAFICDDFNDGAQPTVLNDYNPFLVASVTGFTFSYFRSWAGADTDNPSDQITNPNTFVADALHTQSFARITATNGCHSVARVGLNLIPTPVFNMETAYPLCVGKSVVIDAGMGYDGYLWSTGETTHYIVITEPGNYSVAVFEDNMTLNGNLVCSTTRNFNIFLSDKAVFKEIDTYDWTYFENIITMHVEGIGDYEYSLDNIHYQESPTFTNLENGAYKVYVRDKHGCGTIGQDIFLLMYLKYFTPNQDNYNDRWKIKFSEYEPGLSINIFNREGKLLTVLQNDESWDGTYNGREMPSDDYWFVVKRGNGLEHRGHFTLKR